MVQRNIEPRRVRTARLTMNVRFAGDRRGLALVCVHGNCSDSRFWSALFEVLPEGVFAIAPDQRCYGESDALDVDATRGLGDFSDDLWSLCDALELDRVVLLGHSMGGGVVQQATIEQPARVRALVLEAPASPYGFGGTRDADGAPCTEDFAGSGGGIASAEFVARLARRDRSEESEASPRKALRRVCATPASPLSPAREEELLDAMLTTCVGDARVPGDKTRSPHWPFVAPGTRGVNNALSPKYLRLARLADVSPAPPVLWVRGALDAIVSDTSFADLGYLGRLGVVPGWPGDAVFPPQPMLAQTRAVLAKLAARGGLVREVVLDGCGHSPHIERPEAFREVLEEFLRSLDAGPASRV